MKLYPSSMNVVVKMVNPDLSNLIHSRFHSNQLTTSFLWISILLMLLLVKLVIILTKSRLYY